jgi:hypothetical protein
MIIIDTDKYNGTQKGVNIFYAAPILSGEHKGKFATSENALKEFPEIFEELDYALAELESKDFEIDLTPPTPTGYGVEIPEKFLWAFPENKFVLEGTGFEIPIKNNMVDVAYLQWDAFLDEINKPEHRTIYRMLEGLWIELEVKAKNKEIVEI